jgi:hypothetical protein
LAALAARPAAGGHGAGKIAALLKEGNQAVVRPRMLRGGGNGSTVPCLVI